MKLQQVSKLRQLTVEVLIYRVKALLQLLFGLVTYGVVRGVVVDVRKQDGLRECRFDVFPRATVAVAAGTDL